MRLDIDVFDRGATRTVSNIAFRLGNPRPAFEAVARVLRASEGRRFDTEGYGQWPALAASTIARKQREGQSPQMLQATGKLRDSLTRESAPGSVERVDSDSLTFGTSVFYARFVSKRRPIVDPTAQDRSRIVDTVRDYLVGRP